MLGLCQQGQKRLATPFIAADSQGTQRIAVIALTTCDEDMAFWLADLYKILSSQFQAGFYGLRTTGQKIRMVQIARRATG